MLQQHREKKTARVRVSSFVQILVDQKNMNEEGVVLNGPLRRVRRIC